MVGQFARAQPLARLEAKGPISGGTPFRLYALIAAGERSGRLSLVCDAGIRWEILFRRGNPEFLATQDPELGPERYLLVKNLVSREDLEIVGAGGGSPVDALVATGRLAPNDAFRLLGGYYRALLVRALLLEAGSFEWEEGAKGAAAAIQLGDRWVLLTAIGRRIPFASLERRLGARIDRPILLSGEGLVQWDALGFNGVETRALSLFDGSRSLADLVAQHHADALTILQVGCFLGEAGLAVFAGHQVAGEGRRDAEPPAPHSPMEELEAARLRLQSMEAANFFERLGLEEEASAAAIRNAYLRLARAFHPDAGGNRGGELRKLREAITSFLNEAYDTLGDDGRRARYLEDLRGGGTEKVDVSSILEAERMLYQAAALVRGRRFGEALGVIDEALALHDQEAELWAYRAYAFFASSPDKQTAEAPALADLERARKLNDRSPVVFLFSGRIANVLGDVSKAIRYYERCLELEPGNLDAQRELRLLKSRRAK